MAAMAATLTRAVLDETRCWWDVFAHAGVFHHLVCLITSQKIRFSDGQILRRKMYKAVAPDPHFTRENIAKACVAGGPLAPPQTQALDFLIRFAGITDAELFDAVQRGRVPGAGPWTRAALGIMTKAPGFEDVFLHQDKWVAARAKQLGLDPKYAKTGHPAWAGFRGSVTLFLWRLRPEGAAVMLSRGACALTRAHFL
jgi:hypothetical protein